MQLSATHDDAHIHMHTRLHQPMQVSLYTCTYTYIVPCFIVFARPISSDIIDVCAIIAYHPRSRHPIISAYRIARIIMLYRITYHIIVDPFVGFSSPHPDPSIPGHGISCIIIALHITHTIDIHVYVYIYIYV